MATLREEGQKIAEQLGHGVVYRGPWLPEGPSGEFYGHFFSDDAVTESSFVAPTLEEAKEALTSIRRGFGAEPPVFGNPLETGRIFGKGVPLPLVKLGRSQIVNDLRPMSPEQGPPLPRGLGIRWPRRIS